jgi:hypothetical protein
MRKITKKHIKAIRDGNHATLMDCLDFLLDSYDEDKFDLGYQSCLEDMAVRAHRLAEYIEEYAARHGKKGKDKSGEPVYYLMADETAKAIGEYFNKALKQ